MNKYVIELRPDCKVVQEICESDGQVRIGAKSMEYLEELNADYVNEHYGDLQDTAYQKGLEEGKKAIWEAVRKVIHLPEGVVLDLFTDCYSSVCTVLQVFLKYEGSEVIEKLKAYEEKQKADDCIEIGDEVIYNGTTKCIVVRPENDERYASLIDSDGIHYSADHGECKKTGRHFDISKILEDMRND